MSSRNTALSGLITPTKTQLIDKLLEERRGDSRPGLTAFITPTRIRRAETAPRNTPTRNMPAAQDIPRDAPDRRNTPIQSLMGTPDRRNVPSPTPDRQILPARNRSTPERRELPAQATPDRPMPNRPTPERQSTPDRLIASPRAVPEAKYTDAAIQELLFDGYFLVHPSLWSRIPPGAHVRYFRQGDGPKNTRFRAGGYVRSHIMSADQRRLIILESTMSKKAKCISFPIAHEDIEEIWKRYDKDAFIELHLIHNSLAQKRAQIIVLKTAILDLQKTVSELQKNISGLR